MTACIFDLDGVIIDTAKYHYLAWKRLANELGFDFTEHDNERLKGVSRVRSLEIILEIGGVTLGEAEKEAAATRKNGWYLEMVAGMTPAEILPGVTELLQQLKAQNIRISLGSSSKNAVLILEKVNLLSYFDAIVDGNHLSKAKPDPEVFLLAAEKLGVAPADCVVFEDAEAGVAAAKNAGMYCVGIGDPQTLSAADRVVPNLAGFTF